MTHIKIKDFKIDEKDIFIVDTNVWIMLLNMSLLPNSKKTVVDSYSTLIEKIKENGNKIVILVMGISELFNRYMKTSGNLYLKIKKIKEPDAYKKYYRPSPEYEKDKRFIIENIQDNILNLVEIVGDNASELNTEKLLDKNRRNYDFNDNYFACFAEKFNYKLITYDFDFITTYQDYNFTVITK